MRYSEGMSSRSICLNTAKPLAFSLLFSLSLPTIAQTTVTGQLPSQTPTVVTPAPSSAPAAPSPQPEVICAFALSKAYDPVASQTKLDPDPTTDKKAPSRPRDMVCQKSLDRSNASDMRGNVIGSGLEDLVVAVTLNSWKAAIAAPGQTSERPKLFINGFPASSEESLVSIKIQPDDTVWLQYRVSTSKDSRSLWMALYRGTGLTRAIPLQAALGWAAAPTTKPSENGPSIQITTTERLWLGGIAAVAFGGLFLHLLLGTKAFRDKMKSPQAMKNASFSLARLQAGVWLFFLVIAGIYMWIVLGELPVPDPTLVALMLVSFATSFASISIDGNVQEREATESQGLLSDLITGWDGSQQLHRIQALVINGLLLFVGIDVVVHHLTYPVFEAPWLSLLGVSGIAQAVGKQTLEKKVDSIVSAGPTPAPNPNITPPPPAPVPIASGRSI